MGPTLRTLGLVLLAGAIILALGGEAGWAPAEVADTWVMPVGKIGGLCFVVGIALGLLQPIMRRVRQGRCMRCGAATERGQSYCHDHLKQTVQEAQDAIRQSDRYRYR